MNRRDIAELEALIESGKRLMLQDMDHIVELQRQLDEITVERAMCDHHPDRKAIAIGEALCRDCFREWSNANITDDMVERFRKSLWSTWGDGRMTTDWPSRAQLRKALEAALQPTIDEER